MDKEAWGLKQNQKLQADTSAKVEKKNQAFW
jgi:hypothetical protein